MLFSGRVAAATLLAVSSVSASLSEDRFVRRASHKTKSAASAEWTTINGKQYPTNLGPDAPAPVIQDNWWLDAVQQNDTKLHTFKYNNLPKTSEEGQQGTNICKKGQSSQDSMCQTVLVNSAEDFCLWAPPKPNTQVAVSEEYEVAWCTQDHGARMIPAGTLTSVHWVKTDAYVQITGTGDFTKINIAANDQGGELDPHGATGNGNPVGGLVYTTAFSKSGKHEQIQEWMSEISATDFCFRGCRGNNATSQMLCSHIYDEMGCGFIMPANYSAGIFESCDGEVAMAPGIISTYTFTQGDPVTPSPRNAPASSNCKTVASPSATVGGSAAATTLSAGSSSSSSSAAAGSGSSGSSKTTAAVGSVHTLLQKAVSSSSSSADSASESSTSGAGTLSSAAATVAAITCALALALML